MPTRTRPARPVVRLTSPGEIAGAVPHLCGFLPRESIVLVSLRGARARVGLTLRFDLPPPAAEQALAAEAAQRLRADGAGGAVAVVYTDQDGDVLPRRGLVESWRARCREAGIDVHDALLVRAGAWVSYLCSDARCCPPEGTPLTRAASSAALGLVAAQQAVEGRAVLPSREELAASIAGPQLLAAQAAVQALTAAEGAFARDRAERGRRAADAAALDRWRAAVRRFADPRAQLSGDDAAALAVALQDVLVRDQVVTWALGESSGLLGLLLELVRRTPPPFDAPVCTLLACVAYADGDGGLANVALERVGRSRPGYALAVLVQQALHAQVPPAQVRTLLRATRTDLRRRRPPRA
jgi:hypothetical protein